VVLVIDDTPANLSLLNQLLRPHYRVRLASSGARGLELVAMQAARSGPARHHDAGDGRLRSLPAPEGQS
jgi:CheY-like chemotaxis protein